jgi:three-Cys-motif partner protein
VDGFAGGGQYMHGGILVPGSPLIILDELAAVQMRVNARRTKPIHIGGEFIFIERKKSNVDFLTATVKASPHASLAGNRLNIIHSSFEDALPGVIAHIKSRGRAERAIFFLDQYGYSDVSLQMIRTILEQLANPEIILTFNVDWLINYLSTEEAFLKAVKPVELSLMDVQQMLHLKGQREARWLIQNMALQASGEAHRCALLHAVFHQVVREPSRLLAYPRLEAPDCSGRDDEAPLAHAESLRAPWPSGFANARI